MDKSFDLLELRGESTEKGNEGFTTYREHGKGVLADVSVRQRLSYPAIFFDVYGHLLSRVGPDEVAGG